MLFSVIKGILLSIGGGGLLLAVLLHFLFSDKSSVLIESTESKTINGEPVFNRIYFKSNKGQDVWLMEQSHQGLGGSREDWDKVAIVVGKQNNKTVSQFMQLESSADVISQHQKKINFKVSCFLCHSNGPRAIRPNYNSKLVKLSLWNKLRVQAWNLKIKTYGPMLSEGLGSEVDFRHSSPRANQVLTTKACTHCHNKRGWFARGELTKQNFMAINHMLKNKIMPPLGFSMSSEERKELDEFLSL